MTEIELLDLLTLDDLTGNQYDIAECIGMEAYIKLVKNFAGEPLCVPMPKSIILEKRNTAIINEFDGANYTEIAKKYDLSERTVRLIIYESGIVKEPEPPKEQLRLW